MSASDMRPEGALNRLLGRNHASLSAVRWSTVSYHNRNPSPACVGSQIGPAQCRRAFFKLFSSRENSRTACVGFRARSFCPCNARCGIWLIRSRIKARCGPTHHSYIDPACRFAEEAAGFAKTNLFRGETSRSAMDRMPRKPQGAFQDLSRAKKLALTLAQFARRY